MAFFGMENFAFGDVATAFNNSQTTLDLLMSHTDRFTEFPLIAAMWNVTDYTSPHEAFHDTGDAEILQINSKSGDQFDDVDRGQDGTTPITATSGKVYRIGVIASKSQWDKVCRAQPDGAGPFDAILSGTAGSVTNAMARFVKDNDTEDGIFSIQGSDTDGYDTELHIGDVSTPNISRLALEKNSGTTDTLRLIHQTIEFLNMQGRDRMGILNTSPGQAGGIDVGETMTFSKMNGWLRSGSYTLSSGTLSDVNSHVVRVGAEGGPGSDDLDNIDLASADIPSGSRVLLIVTPTTTAHNITVRDTFLSSGNIRLADGHFSFLMNTQDDFIALLSDGTDNDEWFEVFRTRREFIVVCRDSKTSGTAGGGFTSGAWQTRTLNSKIVDTDSLATLSSNQIILEAGIYEVEASAPGYRCGNHALRLQDTTGATTLVHGRNSHANTTSGFSHAHLHGRFSIGVTSALELQHRCTTTRATDGFGIANSFAATEVYASIKIQRVFR